MTNKVPNIRFKGFTDDWEQRKLGDLSESFEYGLNSAATEYDGENKYIRITDIDDDTREFKTDSLTSPEIDLSNAENYILREGDILFARTGASVGKSYIYKSSDGLAYYAGFLIRARIKNNYNPEFIFQNTLTSQYEKFIKVTSMRSGQPGVNAQEYSQYKIMLPTKQEQDKIASHLRSLDNLITLHQRKCEQTKELKKFMLQKMFPKKGEKNPEIRFSGFTDDWEQRKVRDVADRFDNLRIPVAANLRVPGTTPYYGANGIQDYVEGFTHDGEFVLVAEDGANDLKNYPVKCVKGRIWVNNHAHVLQGKQNIADNQFLAFSINRTDIESLLVGGGRAKLNAETMMDMSLSLPKIEEQRSIGNYISTLDRLIILHQRKCEQLKELKKFMLQNMFPKKG
ncbi:restriction endonuclease subunit S [Streptococcus equinus]|uniref:restriction endonuclease subunit S n=1 Tax=Streptococcus equinus TaxID=1335 RepID=UPI001FB45E83|nr:restriction endonuclease subunit S [Streptococcus equinus]UOC11986.1 restriction endonuclease subunit S [Streptococcus equinus]